MCRDARPLHPRYLLRRARSGRPAQADHSKQTARADLPKSTDPGHALWQRDFTGTSGLVSFAFRDDDLAAAHVFVDALRFFGIGALWGGCESLALIAAPERLHEHNYWQGTTPVVRLHIGLEDPVDLKSDLAQAFAVAATRRERMAA